MWVMAWHLYLCWLLGQPPDASRWAAIGIPDLAVALPDQRRLLQDFGGASG